MVTDVTISVTEQVTLCYENFALAVKSTRHVEHDRSSIRNFTTHSIM